MRSRHGLLLIMAASLLATVPVWIPTLPPMTDLPDHAAQIALLRALRDPAFTYAADLQINWLTPYWLGYVLAYVLTPLVGILAACRLILTIALAALPLTTALILDETGLDRRWSLLVIPSMYGFSYHWGFFTFIVAAPLGLLFVWLILREARQPDPPTPGRALTLAAMSIVLFFCHAFICAFFGIIGVAVLLASSRRVPDAFRRVLPLTAVLPVVALWSAYAAHNPHAFSATTWDLNWFSTSDAYYGLMARTHGDWSSEIGAGWGRLTGIFPRLLGSLPSLSTTLIGTALLALPLIAGARPTRRLTRWLPLLVCVATLLFAPSLMLGIAYTYQRFTVFLVPAWLIALDPPESRMVPRWTWPTCGLLAAAWIAVVTANAIAYEAESAGFPEILARMQPGERALSLIWDRDSPGTIAPPFLHYPVWYAALRGGIVDPSATGTLAVPVSYRPDREPIARASSAFEWTPGHFTWQTHEGDRYRYFVVRAATDVGPSLLPGTRLVHHVHRWWLYEQPRNPTQSALFLTTAR
jgi:hypothetical protein